MLAFAALLLALWLLIDPRTPDLAAQVYRAELFRQLGFAVWDEHWYAGHHLPGYSLLFPPLSALIGVRAVGVLAVLASATLFERLASSVYGVAARWGAAFFALAAVGDVWAGRITFALGVPFALAALMAIRRAGVAWRVVLAVLLALACAAASPVAGALLALAGLTWAISQRRPGAALALGLPAVLLLGALALLFPEGGFEPYPFLSFLATAGVLGLFLAALPARERMLRIGAVVYLAVCVACLAIHTPDGKQRGALRRAARRPPAACSALRARGVGRDDRAHGSRGKGVGGRRVRGAVLAVALLAARCGSCGDLRARPRRWHAAKRPAPPTTSRWSASSRALARPVRIEVPLTRSHWEAALLAPSVSLARGWEKQLDSRYDQVLLSKGLTAASYERWLDQQAVAYVALPDVPLDPSSAQEGRLIRRGLAYLHVVFASAHWRIYEVLAPRR